MDALPPASTMQEAASQIHTTMRAVEDELSGIPDAVLENPLRMKPTPLPITDWVIRGHLARAPARLHVVIVADHGAIDIFTWPPPCEQAYKKAGADGRFIEERERDVFP